MFHQLLSVLLESFFSVLRAYLPLLLASLPSPQVPADPIIGIAGPADRALIASLEPTVRRATETKDKELMLRVAKTLAENARHPYFAVNGLMKAAELQSEFGDDGAALTSLREAVRRAPEGPLKEHARFSLIGTLGKTGKAEEALEEVRRLPNRSVGEVQDVTTLVGHFKRSLAFANLGRQEEARVSYLSGSPPADASDGFIQQYLDFGHNLATSIGGGESDRKLLLASANLRGVLAEKYPRHTTPVHLLNAAVAWDRVDDAERAAKLRLLIEKTYPDSREAAYVMVRRAAQLGPEQARPIYEKLLSHPGADAGILERANKGLDRSLRIEETTLEGVPQKLAPVPDPIGAEGL